MEILTASAIAALAASAMNAGIGAYSGAKSREAMARYRSALEADRSRAAQREDYLENVDPLHTRSGSALSTDAAEKLRDISAAAAGRDAVMGGGGHSAASAKEASSSLMGEYQRSLIRQHEANVVPQLNYYRSRYDAASSALAKADYDSSVANAAAASQALSGMANGISAAGTLLAGGASAAPGDGAKAGNGTKAGEILPDYVAGGKAGGTGYGLGAEYMDEYFPRT